MRFNEFKLNEDELLEVKMSPSNLAKMARDIPAVAGLEFELVTPDYSDDEDEFESEPDWEADESVDLGNWQRDIMNFFTGGQNPNRETWIRQTINEIDEEWDNWAQEQFEDKVTGDWADDMFAALRHEAPQEGDDETEEEYYERLRDLMAGSPEWDTVREEYWEDFKNDEDNFESFMDSQGYDTMQGIYRAFDNRLEWPYWTEYEGSGGESIESIANDFSRAVGRGVVTGSYHRAGRPMGKYAVETDSSIEGEDGEGGLEFISPPLTIPEMLEDIKKVVRWADDRGYYTNESTGLHMNISVPNMKDLDFVKLVMFLGDDYILEQFGREGNHFCQSMMQAIKSSTRVEPGRVDLALQNLQQNLGRIATQVLHTGNTNKYSSINNQIHGDPRTDRIEFRSPGGDWMSDYKADPGKVTNTLLRSVVAVDLATKPDLYKKEYIKKLVKTLKYPTKFTGKRGERQEREDNDTNNIIDIFAAYSEGRLPKTALKAFVKKIQTDRYIKKHGHAADRDTTLDIPDANYEIINLDNQIPVFRFIANTDDEARRKFTDWLAARDNDDRSRYHWRRIEGRHYVPGSTMDRTQQRAAQARSQDQEFTGIWEVVSRNTEEVVHTISGIGNAVADAVIYANRWVQQTGFDDPIYVRPLMRARDDLPRQHGEVQAQGTESLPPGSRRWLIMQNGREIYSFVNRDDQASANTYAVDWLNRNVPNWSTQSPITVEPAR